MKSTTLAASLAIALAGAFLMSAKPAAAVTCALNGSQQHNGGTLIAQTTGTFSKAACQAWCVSSGAAAWDVCQGAAQPGGTTFESCELYRGVGSPPTVISITLPGSPFWLYAGVCS